MTAPHLSQDSFPRCRRILSAAVFALSTCLAASPAGAASPWMGSCAAPRDLLVGTAPLPHMAQKLALGGPVKIVAFGSSSTAGTGASSVAATYPSRFAAELQRLFPQARVSIVNKGVPGEDVRNEMLRFGRDVLDEHPDLLIWQTGTNSALHQDPLDIYVSKLIRGIDEAHAAGIDVLLMSPQFSPRFVAVPNHEDYLDRLESVAALRNVPLLRRYKIMMFWEKSGEMTEKDMVQRDGLHQTDASYYCLGVVTARVVAGLAHRPAFLADVTAVTARSAAK